MLPEHEQLPRKSLLLQPTEAAKGKGFVSLLSDQDQIAANLSNYIAGFSANAREILIDKFKFGEQINGSRPDFFWCRTGIDRPRPRHHAHRTLPPRDPGPLAARRLEGRTGRKHKDRAKERCEADRYHLLNLAHLARGQRRIEFRVFAGTMMRSACSTLFLVVCLFLAAADQAHSQPLFAHAESIEATVANADLVFIATLVNFCDAEQTEGREVHDATIVIEQTLKQDIFTEEGYQRLQIRIPGPVSVLADWKQRSSRLLVAYDGYTPDATTVIELVPGKMEVLKADFTLLRDPEAVIRAAQQALRRTPAGVRRIHEFRLQVPREMVAETKWDEYYATGGYLQLSVPVDKQLENRAIEYIQSESYRNREEGVRALRYFKSDENIVPARMLLDDPGWAYLSHAQENKGVEVRIYGVRREAYRTLQYWGTDVEKPLIREEVRK